MESSILTYLGEICEPQFRGILIGYSFIYGTIGVFTTFLLNTLMAWRTICMVYLAVPIITAISICFIPESPQWNLSKNRTADAEKSLRWLRGWVSSETVAKEFQDLKRHSKRAKSCFECIKYDLECTHPLPTLSEKFTEFKRRQTLRPFFIVISMFFLTQFTGNLSMRPFIVQIFKAYDSPIASDQAVTIMSMLDNVTNVIIMILVRFTGKRRIYLVCISGVLVCTSIISWFGFTYLPPGHISFDQTNNKPFHLENQSLGYIPMICLMMWNTFSYCGLNTVPWMLLSEMFPFKSRGIGSGIAAAMHFIFGFISRRTYYDLETTLSLPGVSLLFACISFIGLILTYNILPETENRSLEDIELHFSDSSKGITDRKIIKQTMKN
ncbi:facilitated trehalose transporter Tret1-like [Contarinia nasturtii]|uniref:facilitated trehalose transporter Tret1-like n=1 Tax=Contarinia nasturtii TaxID=265458 RepID=UPI0012D3E510|nr:facilitated trehalose transporter Tret1-like [Contarinia nasturtii]